MTNPTENRQTGHGGGTSFDYPPAGSYGIGDRIKFHAACRWQTRPEVRTVKGFDNKGQPVVRYAGYGHFVVHPHEVITVVR